MDHMAHLRKQFKSINTYNYIKTLIRKRKTYRLLFENLMVPNLNKLESPSSKVSLCQVSLKLAKWFSNFINHVFLLFRNYLPLEKGMVLHLNNLNSLYPKMLCAKFGWNWSSGFGKKTFKIRQCVFSIW